MKIPTWAKIGCGCVGAVVLLGILIFVGAFIYVVHKQRTYRSLTDTHDLKARVEALVQPYADKRPNGAFVVGVYKDGKIFVKGYGKVSSAHPTAPDGATLFEIGSITKVLTTVELAEMAGAGTVKLEDPIDAYLPAGVTAPSQAGKKITLKQLATHTSGLPRMPKNFMAATTDMQNPYVNYRETNLYADLASVKLQSVPGTKYDYSNYAMGLLGHLLAVKAGKDYETLIRETVCRPLQMNDTVIQLSPAQLPRLAEGHDKSGGVVHNWDMDVLAPAGAFRSDVDDLMKFLEANLAPAKTPIGSALLETQRQQFHSWKGTMGLGWHIRKTVNRNMVLWKNGGTGGYMGFIGFDKAHQAGVVMLSSTGDAMSGDNSLDKICLEILDLAPKISLE